MLAGGHRGARLCRAPAPHSREEQAGRGRGRRCGGKLPPSALCPLPRITHVELCCLGGHLALEGDKHGAVVCHAKQGGLDVVVGVGPVQV